jgi:hypothetical protein
MRKTLTRYFPFFVVLPLFFLSACEIEMTPTPLPALDISDGGFISGEPCGPPCFWNITPDITTEDEALLVFKDYFNIQNCDQWPEAGSHQEIACNPVIIQFSESGIVEHISYSPSQPISVEDAIKKLGEPNAIIVLGWSPEGNNTLTESVTMLLFFDDIQAVIGLPEQTGSVYDIEPLTQIGGISYCGNSTWNIRTDGQPWAGFGKYQGPYWAGP